MSRFRIHTTSQRLGGWFSYPTQYSATKGTSSTNYAAGCQMSLSTPTSRSYGDDTTGMSRSRSGTLSPSVTPVFTSASSEYLVCFQPFVNPWSPGSNGGIFYRYLNAKTDGERKEVEIIRNQHREHVSYSRRRADTHMDLASESLRLFLSITIDGMDSKKAQVPRLRSDAIFSKDVDSSGKPLETRLVGAHLPGRGFFGFWIYPFFKQGGSGCAGLLHRIFSEVLTREGCLPRVLLLHMDNTCKENKNNQMMKYLGFLVSHGVFDEVRMLFLLVGHTHSVIDQRFSVITRHLSTEDAYTLPQLTDIVKDIKFGGGNHHFEEVKQSLDFGWLLDVHVGWKFKGFNTVKVNGEKHAIHAIRISKDQGGTVVFQYKEHDRPGPWCGHFETDEPLPMFKQSRSTHRCPTIPSTVPVPYPTEIRVLPRTRLTKLPLIQEKVKTLFKITGDLVGGTQLAQGNDILDFSSFRSLLSNKREGAPGWWEQVFQDELNVWQAYGPSDPHDGSTLETDVAPDPNDNGLRSWLPLRSDGTVFSQPEDEEASRAALLKLEEWETATPVPETLEISPDYKWVGRFGVSGEIPKSLGTYNPNSDITQGDIVLMSIEAPGSVLNRGWDLAIVDSIQQAQDEEGRHAGILCSGKYLKPSVPGRAGGDGFCQEDWPTGWEKLYLTEFTQKQLRDGTRRRVEVVWDFQDLDVECVVWGCAPSAISRDGAWKLTPTGQAGLKRALHATIARCSG